MHERAEWYNFGPGIYCLLLPFFLSLQLWLSKFNKEDKSVEAYLEPREWPKCVTWPLTIWFSYWVQCPLMLL